MSEGGTWRVTVNVVLEVQADSLWAARMAGEKRGRELLNGREGVVSVSQPRARVPYKVEKVTP